MTYIQVTGGKKLYGDIEIQGSKNAVLPMLAACVLHKGKTTIHHCPDISDVRCMIAILRSIGCIIKQENSSVTVDATNLDTFRIPDEYVIRMRSSIVLLGPLLGRQHFVTIAYPGGCTIGARPIDLHIAGLRQLDVNIIEANDLLTCMTTQLKGNEITLRFPSVGATENILLASVYAQGKTRIKNAAKEPEIDELCYFLCNMGAKISGIGTDCLEVIGVSELKDSEYTVAADRIVAGTYMAAVAATGGRVKLRGARKEDLGEVITVFEKIGCQIHTGDGYIEVSMDDTPMAYDMIRTGPFPLFPTDMQSQVMAVLTIAKGNSIIVENVFEARFKIVSELNRMGANVKVDGKVAVVCGNAKLHGETVTTSELRGGAALVIAGLVAEGTTKIHSIEYILRGYEDICRDLRVLGADIEYVEQA